MHNTGQTQLYGRVELNQSGHTAADEKAVFYLQHYNVYSNNFSTDFTLPWVGVDRDPIQRLTIHLDSSTNNGNNNMFRVYLIGYWKQQQQNQQK